MKLTLILVTCMLLAPGVGMAQDGHWVEFFGGYSHVGRKTGTLDNLKSKTALMNVWATWRSPCRNKLPLLQQLYEQIKDRKDVQVITLNIDEDVSLVEPFLKTNKLSFPTLFAFSFVKEFAGPIGIPTTGISNANGTIRSEALGFGGDTLDWIHKTLKQMESIHVAVK